MREAIRSLTEIGLKAKEFMDRGALVPDELIIGVTLQRLGERDCLERGWILDGFPRTHVQAQSLVAAGIACDAVIHIDVHDDLLIERAVGRRLDPVTGKIYHLKYSPPPDNPEVLSRLLHRSDDTETEIIVRLKAFHLHLQPILSTFSNQIVTVRGDKPAHEVWESLLSSLSHMLKLNRNHKSEPVAFNPSVAQDKSIADHSSSITAVRPPSVLKFWANKQGHIFRTWHHRFFILTSTAETTELHYFEHETAGNHHEGAGEKGMCNLHGYHLNPDSVGTETLHLIGPDKSKDFLLKFDNHTELDRVKVALTEHLQYSATKK